MWARFPIRVRSDGPVRRPWEDRAVFGRSKARIAAIIDAEGLTETPESRGPRHFVGTTERDGVEVVVEICGQQLYRSGEPVDVSPQRVFRRFGMSREMDLLVRPPRGHSTRPALRAARR
jgi:hypothetical protein